MQLLYNNQRFTISRSSSGTGLYIDNNATGFSTGATLYDDNTLGYDNPGVLTKAIRRAINRIVERETGKPAMIDVNIMHELRTYKDFHNL